MKAIHSSNNKDEVVEFRDKIKSQGYFIYYAGKKAKKIINPKLKITKNKYNVYILWFS